VGIVVLKERLYMAKMNNNVPAQKEDLNLIMGTMAREGEILLRQSESPNESPSKKKLESVLGEHDKNPYIRARIRVLKDIDPLRRKNIEEMERTGKTNNHQYQDFVKMVTTLGDKFSNEP
jgi:hypothetical protein